jgi:RimJ/RimL family protein N-acetyltransferase
MMKSFLKEANQNDVSDIVSLLIDMQTELKELSLDADIVTSSITQSLTEHVYWFLFLDENNDIFGTCYLQSVHNYWRAEKRYYLGGFYIQPSHRGKGRFREVNNLLKDWVTVNGGVQIYCHIHQENEKSLATFGSVDMNPTDYNLCVHHWGD